ncbi:metallophosphoesterase [Hyphomonas atlantica corrig.]|uniref:metallophosphoesterase n=1 Tax=Hyphomonas atlantica TaxID=1280948 RepID=UPI0023555F25|nr:metallophosphoesterase [Hyphomonas atlantica]
MIRGLLISISLVWAGCFDQAHAHPGHKEEPAEAELERTALTPGGQIEEWLFWPAYMLPGDAGVLSNDIPYTPPREAPLSDRLSPARNWLGQTPTDRKRRLLDADQLPAGAFTIEFWVTYHVDQPVGAAAMAFDADHNRPAVWQFGFWQGDVQFSVGDAMLAHPVMELKSSKVDQDPESGAYMRGVDRYWHHLVGVFDGATLKLYHQGKLLTQRNGVVLPDYPIGTEFEIAAYLAREPHMELGNLLRNVALYDRALSPVEIAARFEDHRELVDKAIHFRDVFHFTTAAPHVALPTTDSVQLTWEADRPHATLIEWGTTPVLGNAKRIAMSAGRMTKTELSGLRANTAYFYRVTLEDSAGEELNSGLLSFRTAVEPGDPVIFAAISDTEARPHVNAHLADLIWRETPHFMINAGDLTDGGRHDQRVEWTHEYFAAMGHLMAQMPVLPVMGNGENDYVWFDRYHADRGPTRSYYNFHYGDVEVFVLDSNMEARDEQPGFRVEQREWLRTALEASDAKWKIATHHHPVLSERYPELVSDFVDLYEAHDVDLVLVGHHHNYLRSWPLAGDVPVNEGGVIYVQLGGGGGNLSDRPQQLDLRWAKTYQGYGYSLISILGDKLEYRMHDDQGAMRDSFTLEK